MKILKLNGTVAHFILEGANPAFANSLRRIMISEVPTMAIDEVVFLENTSVLYDEIIAHRLGLIPLRTDPSLLDLARGQEVLSKLQVRLILDVEAAEGPMVVYSGHLQSEDPRVTPASKKIPIVKLIEGQRIVLEAYARLGRGREHAKWSPVSACAYRYYPIVRVDTKRCNGCGKCVRTCPKRVLSLKEGKVKVVNQLECNICRYCEKVCPNDAIFVKGDETRLIFYIESVGSLSPEEIVIEASRILEHKAKEFIEQIKSIIPSTSKT